MSTENEEEIVLSHEQYMVDNNVDVNALPDNLDAENEAINVLIDQYSENPTDELFNKIESSSKRLEGKIKSWHESELKKQADAKKAADEEAKNKQTQTSPVQTAQVQVTNQDPPSQATSTPPVTAIPTDDDDDDSNPWDYRNLMK